MKPLPAIIKRILLQLLLLLLCFFISRCCFTWINRAQFSDLSAGHFLKLSFFALRYDLSAIFALNVLYFVLLLLPLPVWKWRAWERFTQGLFITVNVLAFLFEISDWAYYPYNFKRSTADVLKMVGRKGDFWALLPGFIASYWYVPVACILFIFLLLRANKKICRMTPFEQPEPQQNLWLLRGGQLCCMAVTAGISVLAIRGGWQYIPIGLRNAVQITNSRFVPIVVNTPFSIITTYATPGLEEVSYMPAAAAQELIPTTKNFKAEAFRDKNVVVIILESFSKEFTRLGGQQSYTPFLDSLMDHSLVCTQAYANGQHSAEGIPAIISGIPTLMDEAFTTSNYGTNRIQAIPGLLRTKGYSTAFYHGGTNGTMSFDVFTAAAGFQQYYGRTEYHNERDYDGNWGIWDEPFLQYFAQGLGRMKLPFMASVFTLSSHPPYSMPPGYNGKLPAGKLEVQPLIAYTDMALRRFFATAAQQPWFNNTLFVITADHCSPKNSGHYYNRNMGLYAIPVILYAPGDTALRGTVSQPVQQLDILPTVMDYLHFDRPFFAFGNSILRPAAPHFAITESNGTYQWLSDGYLLRTNLLPGNKELYAFPADSNCTFNLLRSHPRMADLPVLQLEAFIQTYRTALIHNKMSVP